MAGAVHVTPQQASVTQLPQLPLVQVLVPEQETLFLTTLQDSVSPLEQEEGQLSLELSWQVPQLPSVHVCVPGQLALVVQD